MIAALSLAAVCKCRSRQLSLALSSAPMNHLECGNCHSQSVDHGLRNTRSAVSRRQKLSGESILSLYSSSYFARDAMRAPCTNSASGKNVRFSTEYDSMALVSVIAASNSPTVGCCPKSAVWTRTQSVGQDGGRVKPGVPGPLTIFGCFAAKIHRCGQRRHDGRNFAPGLARGVAKAWPAQRSSKPRENT